ncbi:hypothetical protein TNIN_400171 [Trichonephila inaurata madagascariensis]|uniref:Uncharacterized protein n=1 Tax=Trichonephila inaurata madagascariensis TaxID=2747483 RepID=A0A8X6WS81_9ARAC|nr:hypothetical protein TNIN_400171 [Trichonephila inaurata madagascariensis]
MSSSTISRDRKKSRRESTEVPFEKSYNLRPRRRTEEPRPAKNTVGKARKGRQGEYKPYNKKFQYNQGMKSDDTSSLNVNVGDRI